MRARELSFRLVAAALVAAALGLVGEGLARGVGLIAPRWQAHDPGQVILVGHPTRLWGLGVGSRQNAGAVATIGEHGLRGAPPPVPRPAGRERVLLTGDSSFFGHGVADDDAPAALLGARLRAAGLDVDTVNAAIPGYSTAQARLLLDEVGFDLQPSLLVICNLWSDAHFDHFRDEDLLRTQRSFAVGLLARSALFRLLAVGVDQLRGGDGAHLVRWTRHSAWPDTGVRRVPPRRYAENLDQMVRDAAVRGVGVVLLTPTNRDMARGELAGDDVRAPYTEAQAAVAAWHGIPRVATLPAFQAAARDVGVDALFLDDLHPSAAGNAAVAEALAQALFDAGWPGARLLGRAEPFDAHAIVDRRPGDQDTTPSPMSPQVNLYPGAPAGAPGPAAAPPAAPPAAAAPAWTLRGHAEAPPGPVELTVRAPSGAVLVEQVLPGRGDFALAVPAGHPVVRVEAACAAGRTRLDVAAGDDAVRLVLGR